MNHCSHQQAILNLLLRNGGKSADALTTALAAGDDAAAIGILNNSIQKSFEYLRDEGFIADFTPPDAEVVRCDGCGSACVRSSGLLIVQHTEDADD